MKHAGRMAVFVWPGALTGEGDRVVPGEAVRHLIDLPQGEGVDHAEGLALFPGDDGELEMLIVHDSPAAGRVSGRSVKADLHRLPDGLLRGEPHPRRGRPRLAAQR